MTQRRIHVQGARVLVMGLTFKENCPDLRNTRVVDIVQELAEYHVQADVLRPLGQCRRSAARIRHHPRDAARRRRL